MKSARGSGRRLVVVGVGRRRDGGCIGPAVVDAVSHRTNHLTAIIRDGDLAVLPLPWHGNDDVVIVDAELTSVPDATFVDVDPDALLGTAGMSTNSSDVAAAIELARRTGYFPASLRVIGIGRSVLRHEPMSNERGESVEQLADELMERLGLQSDARPAFSSGARAQAFG